MLVDFVMVFPGIILESENIIYRDDGTNVIR